MHPKDILALVWKRGWSLRQLALDAGVSAQCVSIALRRPSPKGEKILIDFLGMSGHELWPERYDARGNRIVANGPAPRRGAAA